MAITISTIIITKNEEHNITDCLKSVEFCDEIIVVDSSSTDKTVALCKAFSPKVKVKVTDDWPGFGIQKQRALDLATSDWILSIDADQRMTQNLQQEIKEILPKTTYDGFEIRFVSEYCGKKIRFGDWFNERHMVLFKRSKGQFGSDDVHEKIQIKGKIGKLKGIIHHHSFPNLNTVLKKINDYSTFSAIQKNREGKKGGLLKALFRGLWTFLRGYFLRFGFLDGKRGLMLAISNAEGTYYRYIKLMTLDENM